MSATVTNVELPAATWTVDTVHSSVGFAIRYMVSTFRAEFERFDATLDTTGAEPRLAGSLEAASIQVRNADFAAHLRTPDFFDTERHPRVDFASTAVAIEGRTVVVDGDLTIKGVTRPVQATGEITEPHADPHGRTILGLHLESAFDRTDFGLDWNMALPTGAPALANDVTLVVELVLARITP